MATVQQIQALLNQQKQELLDEFDIKLEAAIKPVRIQASILTAKFANASVSRMDPLARVPRADGTPPTGAFPGTLMQLLVAGNEKLPDNTANDWNKRKSRALLKQYDADLSDASDTDNEYSVRAHTARLKLARVLGVSQSQLNYAQLTL